MIAAVEFNIFISILYQKINHLFVEKILDLISGSIVDILSMLTAFGFISSINISFGDKTIAKTIAN